MDHSRIFRSNAFGPKGKSRIVVLAAPVSSTSSSGPWPPQRFSACGSSLRAIVALPLSARLPERRSKT